MKPANSILLCLTVFLILFSWRNVPAQDDEMVEESPCVPQSFQTSYDQFRSDTLTTQQIQIWYSFAQEEFKHEQYDKAVPYYWKVLVNDNTGTYKIVYSKLYTCYQEGGKRNPDQSIAYLDSALLVLYRGLEKYPDYTTLHYNAGSLQRARGQGKCAIPHYEALLKEKPEEVNYLKVLASLYFEQGDERSLEVQKKVVDLAPTDVEASNLLVEMNKFFGKDPIDAMRDAFERDTTNISNAMRYGREAFVTGDYKASLRAANAVILADASHVDAMELKAKSYEGLNKVPEAINVYKEVLRIKPTDIRTLCAVARAYSGQKNFSAAVSNVSQAKRIDSGNGEPYMVMAQIYEDAVDYCSAKRKDNEYTYDDKLVFEKAREEYQKAQRDPNFASTAATRYNNLASLIPTKEEKFLKNNRTTINDSCYDWMK
jgi:tetratricopeptide (TPR) repeat protein